MNGVALPPLRFALPCVFTTSPFRPSSGAPPYLASVKLLLTSFSMPVYEPMPRRSCSSRLLIMPCFTMANQCSAEPLIQLQDDISHKRLGRRLHPLRRAGSLVASMLPMKLISVHAFKSGNVSFTSAFPLSSSAPIFTIATLGFLIPTTCSM